MRASDAELSGAGPGGSEPGASATSPAEPIRVVLIDDDQLVRSGIRLILESDDAIAVVGEAADGAAGVRLVARERPDVALVDVRMPGVDGIEATRRIVDAGPATRVVILTSFEHDDHVFDALRAGASGFLLKRAPAEQLIDAVRVVAAGDALLSPSVTRRVVETMARMPSHTPPPASLATLTAREREVLDQLATGSSNAMVAAALFISEETVRTHVRRVLHKLDLRDRAQAIVFAYETGIVRPGDGSVGVGRTAQRSE